MILASCGYFWVVLGNFGWFWLVLAGFRWFWLVACFITNETFQGVVLCQCSQNSIVAFIL